ncbi:MAG: HAMP domain-containing histidine kinase, partial [Gammaproteobacteria bacterium]|nr:HAMP domain-containing histidine kinase [Gammaproteobacteria bacterium]
MDTPSRDQLRLLFQNHPEHIDHLLGGLQHELNTPLTIAVANLQLLRQSLEREEDLSDSGESLIPLLTAAENALQQIARVTLSLNALSEESSANATICNLYPLLLEVTQQLNPRLSAAGVKVTLERAHPTLDSQVSAAPAMLRWVWQTLLEQAIQGYEEVEPTSERAVHLSLASAEGGITFRMRTHYRAHTAEEMTQLTTPFAASRRHNGMGLEFYLAHKIIAEHGGELIFDHHHHNRAEYRFTLPC